MDNDRTGYLLYLSATQKGKSTIIKLLTGNNEI